MPGDSDPYESLMAVLRPVIASGLDLEIGEGRTWIDDTVTFHPFQVFAMVDSTTNYVFVDTDSVVKVNQAGFPVDSIPICTAGASGGQITVLTDLRAFLERSTGGAGADIDTGTYVGNGGSQSIAVNFQPRHIQLMADTSGNVIIKNDQMSGNDFWKAGSGLITDKDGCTITGAGFDLGPDDDCNKSGETFRWTAWG